MNKKGGLIESPIVLWAIGILVVILLLWIMLGPEKLLATAKDLIFSFGAGKVPVVCFKRNGVIKNLFGGRS